MITQDLNEFLHLGLQIHEDFRRRVLLNHHFTGHLEVLPPIENDLQRTIMTEAEVSYDSLAHDSCRVLLQQRVRDHGSQCGGLLFNYSVACLSTGEDLMRCSTQREYSLSLTPLLNALSACCVELLDPSKVHDMDKFCSLPWSVRKNYTVMPCFAPLC